MNIYDYSIVPNTENLPGIPARVTAVHKERYEIVCEYGITHARLKTKERCCGVYETKKEGDLVMERTIKSMEEKYLVPALDLVEAVFTAHENAREGKLVRRLVEEIRSKRFYIPELELIMVDENDEVIGFVMFARFHLEGRYENELLLLSPVAVKTELQRQHISRELIEYGFEKAREMGYKAVIVEGNPMNYRSRGFVTSADHGITAHESVGLPAPECLMVMELLPGGLEGIHGQVSYSDYQALR